MNTLLRPVWIEFPKIPWGSIGWRMGAGEDYWHKWMPWYKELSVSEREAYKTNWPEPEGWKDFYAFVETGAAPGWLLEHQRLAAESAAPPLPEEVVITGYHRVLWLIRNHFKRVVGFAPLGEDECLAEIHVAPDGTKWRLSSHATRGGMRFTRLPDDA
jgi:hypothetical protein